MHPPQRCPRRPVTGRARCSTRSTRDRPGPARPGRLASRAVARESVATQSQLASGARTCFGPATAGRMPAESCGWPTTGEPRTVRGGPMERIGVIDTMFARYDMGAEALDELAGCPGYGERFETIRQTVPGFKDLAVAAKAMIEREGCRMIVALGMPGAQPVDKTCAHEAS